MAKLYQISCPKCNNKTDFYRYGKDSHGHQKYQLQKVLASVGTGNAGACLYSNEELPFLSQFAARQPSCTMIGSTTAHYTCSDKKCRHSMFVPKPTAILLRPCPNSLVKTDFKRMRYPCSCDSNGLEHVLPGQELVPQYRIDFAYRDECPSVPHDHQ